MSANMVPVLYDG